MAKYMTQSMSEGVNPSITYYRKQPHHPNHVVTGAFTIAAQNTYAATFNVPIVNVIPGKYRSDQGVPRNPNAVQI